MSAWWWKNRQRVMQLAGTILAIVLLIALVKGEGWSEVLKAFAKIKLNNLIWVALLFVTSRIATILRWHMLLRSGGVDIRFKDSAALTFTGLFASNFLPTTIGGDVVRLAGAIQMGFDRAVCLASIAADRLIGLLGMSMTLPIGLAYSWNLIALNNASFLFLGLIQKPIAFLKRTFSVFGIWLKQPAALLRSLFFAWINMLCLFASIYILVKDLGALAPFWMMAGLWSLTYFITLVPISINGYGLQELSFTFLLTHVAGMLPAMSLSVALLIRIYFLLSSLPGAFFLPSILTVMMKQKENPPPEDILL
jgi:uncharacterized membrane protein YbhN (UPF0104 family)